MSDDEADVSQLIGEPDAATDQRSALSISTRRKLGSRRSHFVFLAILAAAGLLVLVVGLGVGLSSKSGGRSRDLLSRAESLLAEYPVVDG